MLRNAYFKLKLDLSKEIFGHLQKLSWNFFQRNGYETNIGENACRISEGQKQRIAIARTVLKNPKILILDEAFSSVDTALEERIIRNISSALKQSLVIVISHRLSTIGKADAVYFLHPEDGIKRAKHEQLLQCNPLYRNYLACAIQ